MNFRCSLVILAILCSVQSVALPPLPERNPRRSQAVKVPLPTQRPKPIPLPVRNPRRGQVDPKNPAPVAPEAPEKPVLPAVEVQGDELLIRNHFKTERPLAVREPVRWLNTCRGNDFVNGESLRVVQDSYRSPFYGKVNCEKIPLSDEYWRFLNKNLLSCWSDAAKEFGFAVPEKLTLHSWLMYMHKGSRRSKKLSLHAGGRAIDIYKVDMHYPEKQKITLVVADSNDDALCTYKKGGNDYNLKLRGFFAGIRRCWTDKLVNLRKCRRWRSYRYRGSVGWEDKHHTKHIHLSYPHCPRNPNFMGG